MSVAFYGDYDTTETVVIPFNTFSSDDPSASVTITNLAAADVEIHKDGSTTQRASDNGVTVSINFDSVTGNHIVSIDLSDNSDAGFYANGSRYQVRMEGTTVDSGTINAWIGAFSIGCTLRPTTAGRTLDVETGGCAGIDWANVANPTTAVDLSATDIQLCDTVTTLTGHTAQTGDTYGALPSNFSDLAITASTGKVTVGTNDDKTGYSISGTKTTLDALNDITVADIIAGVADGSYDLQEMMRVIFAACAGKSTGGGTATLKFRDSADAKDRITATVDSNGNRTAITLDAS